MRSYQMNTVNSCVRPYTYTHLLVYYYGKQVPNFIDLSH